MGKGEEPGQQPGPEGEVLQGKEGVAEEEHGGDEEKYRDVEGLDVGDDAGEDHSDRGEGQSSEDGGMRNFLREQNIAFEDLGHRLLIYQGADETLFERLSRDYCREGCTLRQATLEDVFLRLTGRELRE